MARDINVVMLPWLAFGHIMPFFQLAVALAKAGGVHVSIISTPNNIKRLPKLTPSLTPFIKFLELPLPVIKENPLPQGAEATVDVPFEIIQYLKVAYDGLKHPFRQLIANQQPDWMIIDMIPHWATDIAREFHIQVLFFLPSSAATQAFNGPPEFLTGEGQKRVWPSPESLTSPPHWFTFPSEVAFRIYEARGYYDGAFKVNASGISDFERVARISESCQALIIRSCREFEAKYLNLLENILGKPAIPIGLLPPEHLEQSKGEASSHEIRKWLDKQKPRSVVFVGFGSECKLTKEQVDEIANGLEASELPFLWALRQPTWAKSNDDALPSGFTERTSGRGLVHMGWATQMEILAHQSIGGSLFHSGWGSAIEALQFGHCLIVLPLIVDQHLNARLLSEKGLVIEVERNKEDGSFSGKDVANALRLAMVSEKGEELKARAREAAALFRNRDLHDHYIFEFVNYLKNGLRSNN